MTTTILSSLVDDSDILSNQRVIDMDEDIAVLDPEVSQFFTMLARVSSVPAFSSKVEWLEDVLDPRVSSVNGAQTDSDTSIEVAAAEGDYFRANDIVRNARTGEAFTVTSVATDTLTVVRGRGRVAAAAMNNGDQLLIVGNAAAQGATLGTRKITKKVAQYNYEQIQRNPYGFTNTLAASKLYGGPEPMQERRKKLTIHKRAIEHALFWGARALVTSGSTPQGLSGGLFEFNTTNIFDAAGALSKTLLDTYMRTLLQHGHGDSKVLFVSPLVAQAISGFLRDAYAPADVATKLWGAKVDGFVSGAYGYKVPLIVKRDWNEFSTSSSQYGGWAFLVDMGNVKYRPLRGTKLLTNRQANDADETTEEYLTEFSLEVQQEQTHGQIVGVTG
jgi:uncharacterized protein DUF5309